VQEIVPQMYILDISATKLSRLLISRWFLLFAPKGHPSMTD